MTNSMSENFELVLCSTELFDTLHDSLGDLLQACVHTGASVNFILPFTQEQARTWWSGQRGGIEAGNKLLLLAVEDSNDVKTAAGCVILQPAEQPNQPHHAEVKKMLVHPMYQRRGLGKKLLHFLEDEALSRKQWLLTLDTETGSAGEKLYTAQGYITVGSIPDFALRSDGSTLHGTTVMYKELERPKEHN